MPSPSAFARAFHIDKKLSLAGYRLVHTHISDRERVQYRIYDFPITLEFRQQTSGASPRALLNALQSHVSGTRVAYSEFGNPYRVSFGTPRVSSSNANTVVISSTGVGRRSFSLHKHKSRSGGVDGKEGQFIAPQPVSLAKTRAELVKCQRMNRELTGDLVRYRKTIDSARKQAEKNVFEVGDWKRQATYLTTVLQDEKRHSFTTRRQLSELQSRYLRLERKYLAARRVMKQRVCTDQYQQLKEAYTALRTRYDTLSDEYNDMRRDVSQQIKQFEQDQPWLTKEKPPKH